MDKNMFALFTYIYLHISGLINGRVILYELLALITRICQGTFSITFSYA